MIHNNLSQKSKKLQCDTMTKDQNEIHGELLMLCGALHDIVEISSQENVRLHVETIQKKLEKITVDQISIYEKKRRPKNRTTKISTLAHQHIS